MSSCYLLDAKTEGRIVVLRFYVAGTGELREVRDSGYKPYFYVPYPCSGSDEEGIRSLYGEKQVVKKSNLFTGEVQDFTRVAVFTLDAFRKAGKTFSRVWESEVEYTQSYVYDHGLVFGAPYTIDDNRLILAADVPEGVDRQV